MNKITSCINGCTDDWTAERTIIAGIVDGQQNSRQADLIPTMCSFLLRLISKETT